MKKNGKGARFTDLSGRTFGYLTILKRAERGDGRVNYLCRCLLCDGLSIKNGYYIKKGHTISCGCLRSRGERRLIEILSGRGIDYGHDKGFQDCRGLPSEKKKSGLKLRFDFVIHDGPRVAGIIEYDGKGHFEPCYNRKNIQTFERALVCDRIKDNYCRDKGIPLLRIKYTEFDNMENIADDFLRKIMGESVCNRRAPEIIDRTVGSFV